MKKNKVFVEVKTGVSIEHINKFRSWAEKNWPVSDYGKYGVFPRQFIIMMFHIRLEHDVMIRVLNGELSEDNIKKRFEKTCIY